MLCRFVLAGSGDPMRGIIFADRRMWMLCCGSWWRIEIWWRVVEVDVKASVLVSDPWEFGSEVGVGPTVQRNPASGWERIGARAGSSAPYGSGSENAAVDFSRFGEQGSGG